MNIGMVFGIIFAIIVVGFVFAFAVPLMMDTGCNQEQLQLASALNDLDSKISAFYLHSEGSMTDHTLNIPGNVKICFINPDYPDNPSENLVFDPAVKTIISDSGKRFNVWYTYCDGENGEKIDYLFIEPGQGFCIQGTDKIWLENKGNLVKVSRS